MKVSRFKVKEERLLLVIQTDDHQVIQMKMTAEDAKKLHKELGKGIEEFDN